MDSFPLLTGIKEVRWLNPDNPEDFRLFLKTTAAPKNRVQVAWNIFRHNLLFPGINRDRFEIKVLAGTPQAGVRRASWATSDPNDIRLRVQSQAEGPFRWFNAEWRVYYKEVRQKKVIDEIPIAS